jgi:hypothetical protein
LSDQVSELRAAFIHAGWRRIDWTPAVGAPAVDGLFFGGFATCAVVLAQAAPGVTNSWTDVQGQLAQLRIDGVIDKSKDLYLVFVVERVDEESTAELQRALDDTRVCRKICLERRGRSLRETLNDIPFFPTPGTSRPTEALPGEDEELIEGLPPKVRSDLQKRSPEQILTRLLDGEYEVT